MAKLRKMLGDVNGAGCAALMRLIETQSKQTLAAFAIGYAQANALPVFEKAYPEETRLTDAVAGCRAHLRGDVKLADVKPLLRAAAEVARACDASPAALPNDSMQPAAVAAARAVATACATVQTPTNALGFVFYCAAARAYDTLGIGAPADAYDALAEDEFIRAREALAAMAVENEAKPAKIKWGC